MRLFVQLRMSDCSQIMDEDGVSIRLDRTLAKFAAKNKLLISREPVPDPIKMHDEMERDIWYNTFMNLIKNFRKDPLISADLKGCIETADHAVLAWRERVKKEDDDGN